MSWIPDSSRTARVGLGAALGLLSLLPSESAEAQLPPGARHEYLRGAGLYKTRHFVAAAQAFSTAYAQYPSARLLYDLGQTYRKAGQREQALASYEKFLAAERGLSPTIQSGVRSYIAQLRVALGKPVSGPILQPKVMPDLLDPALGPRPAANPPALPTAAAPPSPPPPGTPVARTTPSAPAASPPGYPSPSAAGPRSAAVAPGASPPSYPLSGATGARSAAAAPPMAAPPGFAGSPGSPARPVGGGLTTGVPAALPAPAQATPSGLPPTGAIIEQLPRRQLPGKWTIIDPKPGYTLRRAYCTPSEVFVIGDSSMVLAATDGQVAFGPLRTGLPNWFASVSGSAGAAGGELFIGGDSGLVLRRVGPQLHAVASGIRGTVFSISGSATDWFAFGEGGAAARWDGNAFTPVPTATQNAILGSFIVDREVFAVGAGGMILRWGGASFTSMPTPTRAMLHGIWGSSRNDLWAVGGQGTLLHFEGSGWRSVPSGTQQTLLGIWGAAKNDVYAVGTAGLVLHYDGISWAGVDVGAGPVLGSVALSGICSRAGGELFVVGDGLILRYKR